MPTPQRPARRPPRRPGPKPQGPTETIVPSFPELMALLAPFAGAAGGAWIGIRMGTVWHAVIGGIIGTGIGAVIARRGAPEILP